MKNDNDFAAFRQRELRKEFDRVASDSHLDGALQVAALHDEDYFDSAPIRAKFDASDRAFQEFRASILVKFNLISEVTVIDGANTDRIFRFYVRKDAPGAGERDVIPRPGSNAPFPYY